MSPTTIAAAAATQRARTHAQYPLCLLCLLCFSLIVIAEVAAGIGADALSVMDAWIMRACSAGAQERRAVAQLAELPSAEAKPLVAASLLRYTTVEEQLPHAEATEAAGNKELTLLLAAVHGHAQDAELLGWMVQWLHDRTQGTTQGGATRQAGRQGRAGQPAARPSQPRATRAEEAWPPVHPYHP